MPFASPRPPYVFVSESSPYPPLLTPPSPHQNLATPGTPDYKLAVSLFNQNHTESYEPPAHYDYDYPKYNATVPEPSSQTKFRCDCGKEFESLKKLESHSRTHREKPDKPHVCEQCQRGFTRRQDLKRHSEIHFRLFKPFACAKCSTTFTRSDALQRHLKARRCQ
ncbi:hypothetical protein EDD86DRAFT_189922 [Gorgonomyces haynaldii]|nr:hypothetical protein EDD86DRAFT_189922 [Gorgonomyces haynaldii]